MNDETIVVSRRHTLRVLVGGVLFAAQCRSPLEAGSAPRSETHVFGARVGSRSTFGRANRTAFPGDTVTIDVALLSQIGNGEKLPLKEMVIEVRATPGRQLGRIRRSGGKWSAIPQTNEIVTDEHGRRSFPYRIPRDILKTKNGQIIDSLNFLFLFRGNGIWPRSYDSYQFIVKPK